MLRVYIVTSLILASQLAAAGPARAQCDPNDPITGLPDLSFSYLVWSAEGLPATLLVVPDGSGPPFTAARRPDGTTVDATITLVLDHPCGPFANFARQDMWLETVGGGFVSCSGGTIADVNTDATGTTRWRFPLRAGGHSNGACVVVINGSTVPGMPALDLRFNSPDLNGDGNVNLTDVPLFSAAFNGTPTFAADLHADGSVNLADVPVLARSIGARCPN